MGMAAGSSVSIHSNLFEFEKAIAACQTPISGPSVGKYCTSMGFNSYLLFFWFKKMKAVRKTASSKKIDRPNLKKTISCNPDSYVLTLKRMPPKI